MQCKYICTDLLAIWRFHTPLNLFSGRPAAPRKKIPLKPRGQRCPAGYQPLPNVPWSPPAQSGKKVKQNPSTDVLVSSSKKPPIRKTSKGVRRKKVTAHASPNESDGGEAFYGAMP